MLSVCVPHLRLSFKSIDHFNDLLFFYKRPTSASFSFIFGLSKQTLIQFLQQINVKKCPSSIRHLVSNPRPYKHESSPITTRPGLTHYSPLPSCPFCDSASRKPTLKVIFIDDRARGYNLIKRLSRLCFGPQLKVRFTYVKCG